MSDSAKTATEVITSRSFQLKSTKKVTRQPIDTNKQTQNVQAGFLISNPLLGLNDLSFDAFDFIVSVLSVGGILFLP